jgi:hypothetical protein
MKITVLFALLFSLNLNGQALQDSSFEQSGALTSTAWTSTSTNFGTSLCSELNCGLCGGPCVPRTGDFYVWFGGTAVAEIGTASQNFITTTTGEGQLTYYLKVPRSGFIGDTLDISIDGNSISKLNTVDSIGEYQLVTVDVGLINAGSHSLDFVFEKLEGALVVNVLIDDVQLRINSGVGFEEVDFSNGIKINNDLSNELVTIAYNLNQVQSLEMEATDLNGKLISIRQFDNEITGEKNISTAEWAPGVYQISIRSNKGFIKSTKIIVQ